MSYDVSSPPRSQVMCSRRLLACVPVRGRMPAEAAVGAGAVRTGTGGAAAVLVPVAEAIHRAHFTSSVREGRSAVSDLLAWTGCPLLAATALTAPGWRLRPAGFR
ncbi:hypothetical protein HKX69_06375 [Streptomyces argyrophyllae]|uniref:Uncharacterized protein n=1 Tax=Streptomyces argyrophylli TaxID=2726118 RepID=A0A6M4PFA6_9ACTN|nr:hypothetical protein [Streptomyces argyrophyllae]QJS09179.1 hypothetical protein HKX69_06375 [Streptomyces argyrophyllae]